MSMATLEREILAETKAVTKRNLKKKDILEWSTGDVKVKDGEEKIHLPALNIDVVIKKD